MRRFQNPHAQFVQQTNSGRFGNNDYNISNQQAPYYNMQQPMMQPMMQQPMQPMMQQPMMQPMMQQPMQPMMQQPMQVMTQNGPMMQIMTQNGPMLVPMQNNFQNNYDLNRFGGNRPSGEIGNVSITSSNNSYIDNSSYRDINNKKEQRIVENKDFTLFNNIPVMNEFSKYKIGSKMNVRISDSDITHNDGKVVIVDCLEEALEYAVETTNNEEKKTIISLYEFVINKSNNISEPISKNLYDLLLSDKDDKESIDVSNIYRKLSSIIRDNKLTRYDVYAIEYINTVITEYINDYLTMYIPNISIDSFIDDFNDLQKALSDNDKEQLFNYINTNIEMFKDKYKCVDVYEETFTIIDSCDIAYIDRLSIEVGLYNVPYEYVKLSNNDQNAFIKSLVDLCMSKLNSNYLYIATLDRDIFKVMKNISGNIFIKAM